MQHLQMLRDRLIPTPDHFNCGSDCRSVEEIRTANSGLQRTTAYLRPNEETTESKLICKLKAMHGT
jgi:hypothetical protein